jgi:uncharacterized protein DUF3347
MRFIYIVFLASLVGIAACNNGNNSTSGNNATTNAPAKPKEPAHSKLSDGGTQLLMTMVTRYYGLKNALVTAKAAKADSAATDLAIAADGFLVFLQKDSVNGVVLKPYMDTIIAQSKMINTIKDESCERQRISFDYISRDLYAMLKNVDMKNGGIYHEYCPMAFNERGAYWLSDDADIKNPYFGKKMLECGEVADSL